MSRRRVYLVMLSALALTACAGHAGGSAASRTRSARGGRGHDMTVGWSDDVHGIPQAMAADAHGEVATISGQSVVALDRDGEVEWSVPLDGASAGPPVLAGGRVIVPVSRDDGSGGCAGLDRDTGETRWTYEAPGTAGVAVGQADDTIAVCVMRNGVTAGIAINSGFVVWQYAFGGGLHPTSGAVADRTPVAIGAPKDLFAFTARVGRRWVVTLREITTGGGLGDFQLGSQDPPSAPVSLGHGVIAIAQPDPSRLLVFDANTSRSTRIAIPGTGGFDPAVAPVVAGGVVVVAARSGDITAIDVATKRPRWSVRAAEALRDVRLDLVGDSVLLTAATGRVAAYGLVDGRPVGLPPIPGRVVATAAAAGEAGAEVTGLKPGGGWIERWVTSSAATPAPIDAAG